jgi:hypothetical protein
MRVLPPDYFPAEAKTDEERFEHLGKRLFAVTPEELKAKLEADEQQHTPKKRGRRPNPQP